MSTKTARKPRKSKFSSYEDIRHLTEVPLQRRREVAIGRGNEKVKPMKHHLDEDQIAKLRERWENEKIFPNPYNSGNYHFILQALWDMGVDEDHSKSRVFSRIEKLMSDESTKNAAGETAWERFSGRQPRGDNAKDVEGRMDQNVLVLQRLTGFNPYGLKILQVFQEILGKPGGVIDIIVNETTGTEYLRLNTKSTTPRNDLKTRGMGSPAAIKAERAAARAAKKAGTGKRRKAKRAKTQEQPQSEPEQVPATT